MPDREEELLVQRLFDEVLNQGRLDILQELVADEFEDYVSGENPPRNDASAFEESLRELRRMVPDIQFTLDRVVAASSDTVVAQWSVSGTFQFWPLPPTEIDFYHEEDHFRVVGGRISAWWRPSEDDLQAAEPEDDDDGFAGPPPGPPWVPPKPSPLDENGG